MIYAAANEQTGAQISDLNVGGWIQFSFWENFPVKTQTYLVFKRNKNVWQNVPTFSDLAIYAILIYPYF